MIYHLFKVENYHHVPKMIEGILRSAILINPKRGVNEHFFILRYQNSKLKKRSMLNQSYSIIFNTFNTHNYKFVKSDFQLLLFFSKNLLNNRLIIHDNQSIFGRPTFFWLFMFFKRIKFRNKATLILWGVPLINKRSGKLFDKLLFHIKSKVLKSLKKIVVLSSDDEMKMKNWFSLNNTFVTGYPFYDSVINYNDLIAELPPKTGTETLNILLSHSAHIHNNHIEAMEMLKQFNKENINIICPLSYGNNAHRKTVIDKGKSLFGEKFNFILELLPRELYDKLLASVDIYISNASIQTGLYVVNTLMASGKKMYLKDNILNYVKEQNFYAFDIEMIKGVDFSEFKKPLEETYQKHNIKIGIERQKNLAEQRVNEWKKIYSE
jgi:dTDP-N-acetylfucosamine:lipid II N-acetylfucosaminyltransferase